MADIFTDIQRHTGIITLTRPHALNALTMEMCHTIDRCLRQWAENNQIKQVILRAEGDKSFCAGGDVAALYHLGKAGKINEINQFWRSEYQMNSFIAHYPKPIIAMMQGYVMGGGVGIGCHASHRVICETTKLAMPECAIGLIPDVGGSHLLARTDGHIGEYLALTGARITPADILETKFADYHIPANQWDQLTQDIIAQDRVQLLEQAATSPEGASVLAQHKGEIDSLFGVSDYTEFAARIKQSDTEFAQTVKKGMAKGSPISMASIFTLIRQVRKEGSVDKALDWEYRFTSRAIEQADFLEGVRAVLIDKDHAPKWQIAQIQDVPESLIDNLFAPASRQ